MRIERDDCVCCDLPCISCGLKHRIVSVCDECGCECDDLYTYGNEEVCMDCLLELLTADKIITKIGEWNI